MRSSLLASLSVCGCLAALPAVAASVTLQRISPEGVGDAIGEVELTDSDHGLLLTPSLEGLEPGVYGFHVHQNPSCEPAENAEGNVVPGLSAGGHYDPDESGEHAGPYGGGHLGDLPALAVDAEGRAGVPLLAPRLSVEDLAGRSLMLHAGGDNYSDEPSPLGGGGARMACGVVPF
ncbi:superoxide dismutase [Cu-Zn] SodC [Halomonas sp. NCCP-2165]|nr:superoxide dismutase [Cu-Zn] SodC [Halomonas sp. NCCP-2165]GKW49892.1 superoxide dismutase [Cu-Zn] [Halomonas sp. NCCP-2165]